MIIEQINVTVGDLAQGYVNNAEEGVSGYDGKLDIRPKYQREFVYKDEQRMVSGRITKARAVELTSKSRATIQKILKRMEDSGLLIWHGNNRNDPTQYYTLE